MTKKRKKVEPTAAAAATATTTTSIQSTETDQDLEMPDAPSTADASSNSTNPSTDDDSSSRNCRPRTAYDWWGIEGLYPETPEQWHECHLKLIQQEEAGEVDDEDVEKEEEIDVLITNATKTMRPSESHLAPIPLEVVYSGNEEEVEEARELMENPDARETALDEVLHQLDHLPESMRTLLEQMIANHNADDHPLKYCSVEEFHVMVDLHLHPSGGGEFEYVGKLVQQLESALKLSQYELSKYMKTKELDFNEMGPFLIEQKRIKEELIKQRAILFPLESPLWQACVNYLKKVRKCLDRDPVSIGQALEFGIPHLEFGFLIPSLLSSSLMRDQTSSSEPLQMDVATPLITDEPASSTITSTSTVFAKISASSSTPSATGLDEMKVAAAELTPSNSEQDHLSTESNAVMEESDDEDEEEQVDELLEELNEDRSGRYQWMCDQIKEYERIRRGPAAEPNGILIWSEVDTFLKETNFIGKEVKQTIQFLFTQPNFTIDRVSPVIEWVGWGRMNNDTPLNPGLPLDRKLLRGLDALMDCIIEFMDDELDEYDILEDEHRLLEVSADGLCRLADQIQMNTPFISTEWREEHIQMKLVEELRDRIENSGDTTMITTELNRRHHTELVHFYADAQEALRQIHKVDHGDPEEEEYAGQFIGEPMHELLQTTARKLEQYKTELIIPRRSMEFLIRELAQIWTHGPDQGWSPLYDFEPEAIDALHHAAEAFLVERFNATGIEIGSYFNKGYDHPNRDRILTTFQNSR